MVPSIMVVSIRPSLCPQRSLYFVAIIYEMPNIKKKKNLQLSYKIH